MLPINDLLAWLRESAATLRAGGAEASACVYDEIADELAFATCDIRTACEDQVKDAERQACMILPPGKMLELHDAGLMVVPIAWGEVKFSGRG